MGYYLYQLAFDAPVHFGDTAQGGSLERDSWEFTADRLFSSLCCELANHGEQARLDQLAAMAQQGDFLISDLLPYQLGEKDDLELFLPVPYTYMENKKKYHSLSMSEAKSLSAMRKKSKKMAYCRISEMAEYCQCLASGRTFAA